VVSTFVAWALAGGEVRTRRAAAVTGRNLIVFRAGGFYMWLVIVGFIEPVLYLAAMGWGLGALVGAVHLPDGRTVPYPVFLAPAMLAASAMNGSLAEATINFFVKLRYRRLYDAVLNTPVTPQEIAVGEIGWALARAGLYAAPFLAVMVALGLTTPLRALAALPAALLAALAFGSLGVAISTFMRGMQDFEYLGVIQFAMFLFSGTFVPFERFPPALQAVVLATPLYHAVALVRGITLERPGWGLAVHAAVLVLVALAGVAVAGRRMRRLLAS